MSKAATVQVYGAKTNGIDIPFDGNNTPKWLVSMVRLAATR